MALWSSFLPDLLPHVAGCPNVVAEFELKRSAQEFFKRSRSWRIEESAFAVSADDVTVTITPSDDEQQLVRVERATYDGRKCRVTTVEYLSDNFGESWQTHTGTPFCFFELQPGVVRLYPIPSADAVTGFKPIISVAPNDSATGIPDIYADKYRDVFHVGAKARLMIYPKKPWTDPGLAGTYSIAFANLCTNALHEASRSFTDARIAARPTWC